MMKSLDDVIVWMEGKPLPAGTIEEDVLLHLRDYRELKEQLKYTEMIRNEWNAAQRRYIQAKSEQKFAKRNLDAAIENYFEALENCGAIRAEGPVQGSLFEVSEEGCQSRAGLAPEEAPEEPEGGNE